MITSTEQAELVELVVDSTHQDVVADALRRSGVWHDDPGDGRPAGSNRDASLVKSLGLVLFTGFGPLHPHAVRVRRAHVNEIAALETNSGRRFTDLDLLLFDLRREFADRRGMVPVMGKNRDVAMVFPQSVEDLPGFASKDAVPPEMIDEGQLPPVPPLPDGHDVSVGVVDSPFEPEPGPSGHFTPWAGHARFVVGLIRRQAPASTVHPRPGLSGTTGVSTSWDVARQIATFVDGERIDILNLSLGVTTDDGEPPLVLRRAIDRLGDHVLVVAAAGNRAGMGGADTLWPAAMTDVAAVGATTEFKSHFSPRKLWVDFTADGVDVVSDYLTGDVEMSDGRVVPFAGAARWTGTSFAAATVSGAVAAQLSRMRGADKEATTADAPRDAREKITAADALRAVADAPGSPVARYVHVPSG